MTLRILRSVASPKTKETSLIGRKEVVTRPQSEPGHHLIILPALHSVSQIYSLVLAIGGHLEEIHDISMTNLKNMFHSL